MSADQIAQKLWGLCNVLRDDGVTYHQYLNELTYILFLKLSEVKGFEEHIPDKYRWRSFVDEDDNNEAFVRYRKFLAEISNSSTSESIKEIYTNASTSLKKPVNFDTLVQAIDKIDWYEEDDRDTMGDIYESLLEKNAGEKKSGAGQYFTPRPLINVMVDLLVPKLGERWNDPAAGTFGFMISANQYLRDKNDNYYKLSEKERKFQEEEAFSGVELVGDAHRLALMNARLHGLESKIYYADTLTEFGKGLKNYDGVLANPPFGTKKGGERPSRDDFTFPTSNKQLNFLQHIYRSLKRDGKARAAVVLPDNVLFEDGDGQRIRRDLMDKCDLHTILRLPTGIFYAAGVKTNVLFFTRSTTEIENTKRVWFYDMRTNVPNYGKRTPFTETAFEDFVKAYTGGISVENVEADYDGNISDEKRKQIKDERWKFISREEIAKKDDSLDLGLIADESISNGEDLGEPIEIAEEALAELNSITAELNAMIKELK
ncbi:class I SAM-dependent DNA methyltransferase [Salegentibacter mishustinae]|uniref:site-specific DNA-methyltransferase (adenine-specific) n=1 Tax=Salegentibacter mishustinae TaxID=270918 RepID=A0A0Q9ZJI8_9FLAO|nr:N-6 DNA methylase [Salegentibacter mishustinae]KRG29025.1 SAM-dependent methyltransferase [Salegentibacter mishustinae]PNW21923.1 SAM-dependent methyltransferase [Salegentibacter mishustinae]PZX65275.1 type I restriction enzyme M protein [Salegentibacter mishustinae]GGW86161.1 type I restriction endonuclease [Salegentibacter mishustinae]